MPIKPLSKRLAKEVKKRLMKQISGKADSPLPKFVGETSKTGTKLIKCQSPLGVNLKGENGQFMQPCPSLNNSFQNFEEFIEHLEVVHLLKPHFCKMCNQFFHTGPALLEHKRSQCEANLFQCKQCDKTYKSKRSLSLHMTAIHGPLAQCDYCSMELKGAKQRKQHMKMMHQLVVACDECCSTFNSPAYLLKHKKRCHKKQNSLLPNCQEETEALHENPDGEEITKDNLRQFLPEPEKIGLHYFFPCPFLPCGCKLTTETKWIYHCFQRHLSGIEVHEEWMNRDKITCNTCQSIVLKKDKRQHDLLCKEENTACLTLIHQV